MKKVTAIICLILFTFATAGCGDGMRINGAYCDTYGLLNRELKCDGVQYKTIVGNVILGVVLFETVLAPIYFFGFSLYEPIAASEPEVAGPKEF